MKQSARFVLYVSWRSTPRSLADLIQASRGRWLDWSDPLCYAVPVLKARHKPLQIFLLFSSLLAPACVRAQDAQQEARPEDTAYGSRFFDQLRSIFGRFREADLQHAFQAAEPVRCSELVVEKGEWRTVAFFNEDRSLGEWCSKDLSEVKSDPSRYIFKGSCRGDQSTVQVSTEFPVGTGVEAYNAGRIGMDQIDINVNDPVNAAFDPRTQAYVFELPFLFLTGHRAGGNVYSLIAPNVNASYASDVTSRWECKAVKSNDVTYRFLICRTATLARKAPMRNQGRDLAFGASAFFILSDGMEARTSVSLSFGDAGHPVAKDPETASPVPGRPRLSKTNPETAAPAAGWQIPGISSKLVDLEKSEIRLRFSPQTWTGRIGSPEVLSNQRMSSSLPRDSQQGTDYCAWRPGASNQQDRLLAAEPSSETSCSMEGFDKQDGSAAAIVFDLKSRSGTQLGTLECFFPSAASAKEIDFDRWISVVGGHLSLEVRR